MADRGYSENFRTPDGVLGFDRWLFEAEKKVDPKTGKESFVYGATLIFPKTTSKAPFEAAIMEACLSAGWGSEDKIKELIGAQMIRSPFLDGAGKEARNKKTGDLHPGMGSDVWFIRTGTRVEGGPPVRWNDPNIPATKKDVYAGCKMFSVLNAYTWENKENGKGVSFGLQYLQKVGDGERHYTGGASAADPNKYFEKVENTGAAPDATKNGAGAGGLFG